MRHVPRFAAARPSEFDDHLIAQTLAYHAIDRSRSDTGNLR